MKRTAVIRIAAIAAGVALLVLGCFLWARRPWRAVARVNGHVLTAGELSLRATTLLDDAKRIEKLIIPAGREEEVQRHYRRRAAKLWIAKEVLLAEAIARGVVVTPEDEKNSLARFSSQLKKRNLTAEQFFKEGPLPESLKRQDYKEGILINKFSENEVRDKIKINPAEVDKRLKDLQKIALVKSKPGEKSAAPTRKHAIDSLRAEAYHKNFRELFRTIFEKAEVKCVEFPELEKVEK